MKVVLLGASGFAEMWYETIMENKLEVTALIDIREEALNKAAKALHVNKDLCFNNINIDWNKIECDLLIDSTPPFKRVKRLSLISQRVKKAIICAKPYAISRNDEELMQKLATESNCDIYVAFQKREFSPFTEIKNLIQKKESLNSPKYIKIDMDMDGTVWKPGKCWRTKLPFSSLIDGAIHHLDLLDWWFNMDLDSVEAYSWSETDSEFINDPNFCANYKYSNGCIVQYSSRWTNKKSKVKHYFSDLVIEFENDLIELRGGKLYYNGSYIKLEDDSTVGMNLSKLNKKLFPKIQNADSSLLVKNREKVSNVFYETIDSIKQKKIGFDYDLLVRRAFENCYD